MGIEAHPVRETIVRFRLTADERARDHRFFTAMAAVCATVVFVGLGAAASDLAIDATIRRELTLRGSHFWTLGAFDDIVALYRRAGVRPGSLVTRMYPLDEAATACRDAVAAVGKLVLRPGMTA